MKTNIVISLLVISAAMFAAKKNKQEQYSMHKYGVENVGTELVFKFEKGKEHNYPLFAIWLADENGKYIQTLYVSESIGKGVFDRSKRTAGKWQSGEIQRPATLPYWLHQRNVKNDEGGLLPTPKQPVVDAYTGATPLASFILSVKTEKKLEGKYRVMLELNQSWDWNEYWFNAKFPDDKEYKTSSQPALVFMAEINSGESNKEISLKPIGHSHYSGKDGSLNPDISTLSTALKIARKITVKVTE